MVVNFASINAYMPKPEQPLYSASNAAVVHLTTSMAITVSAMRLVELIPAEPGPAKKIARGK